MIHSDILNAFPLLLCTMFEFVKEVVSSLLPNQFTGVFF